MPNPVPIDLQASQRARNPDAPVIVLLALHAIVGLGIIAFGGRLGRRGFALGLLPPLATLVWFAFQIDGVLDGTPVQSSSAWVGALDLTIDLRLDGFAALMLVLVAGIGVCVFAYSLRYFKPKQPGLGRLAGLLVLFAGSMLGLVLADNLLLLYSCWELTSITSYLLIGNDHTKPAARAAALQALLITAAGGLAMLLGFVLIGQGAGTYSLSGVLADPPSGAAVTAGLVLVAVGAFTKSAQYPFHSWLPGAMAAPTPVSAYLHSATMVKAGVYLLARFSPAFGDTTGWRPMVLTVGVVTMVLGGLRALRQVDLKLLLAFGTVSQLGFLVVLAGAGTPAATTAACVMLLTHGAFKGALFMVVGVIDHQTGTRDIRRIPKLGAGWGPVKIVTAVSLLSMAGVAPLLGFVGKESAYEAIIDAEFWGAEFVLVGIVVGSVLTFAYSARFWWGAFVMARRTASVSSRLAAFESSANTGTADEATVAKNTGTADTVPAHTAPEATAAKQPLPAPAPDARPPVATFVAPAALLAVASVVFGLAPGLLDRFVDAATMSLDRTADAVHLALWHGVNLALVLSAVTILLGVTMFLLRRRVGRILAVGARVPSGDEVYLRLLRRLNTTANAVTGVVQSGSLPVYAGVILVVAAASPVVALLVWGSAPELPDLVDTGSHIPITAVLLASALAAAIVRRRVSAAVFLGMVGYAMAALFVVQGAPDLAVTQTAIETLSTVLFVLVLRRLPDGFERTRMPRSRVIRGLVAGVVGVTVFAFAMYAGADREAIGTEAAVEDQIPVETVSEEMVRRAEPDGGGRNVVNVILTDFRGFDTMGEITVMAVAAIGAAALARADRRPRGLEPIGDSKNADGSPKRGFSRVLYVDESVRIIFPIVILASLWLLFAGHNQPGGGFAGGLLAGAAISLRYVAGGIDDVRLHSRFRPWTVLGSGLLVSAITAVTPLLFGKDVLEAGLAKFDLPLIGQVKLTSALVFDVGVYMLVVGLVLMVFESFGDDPQDAHAAAASARAAHELAVEHPS